MQSEAYALVGQLAEDPALPIDDAVRARVLAGARVSASDYLSALRQRDVLKEKFSAAFANFDAVLTPTTQTAAIPVASVNQQQSPAHFTRFVNLLELRALAVPNGFTAEGLPTSLQIVCRGYDEDTALRIGWAYQSFTDWHDRLPPAF